MVNGACAYCTKTLSPQQKEKRQKFCSSRCSGDSRNKHPEKTCGVCGKVFKKKNIFCCRKCAYIGMSASHTAPEKVVRKCAICRKKFAVRYPSSLKKTCSPKCFGRSIAKRQMGRVPAPEENIKRSNSIKLFNLKNPEKLTARIAAAANGLRAFYADFERSAHWRETQSEHMRELMASEIGTERKAWHALAFKRAQEALRSQTEFVDLWTLTLDRLRHEHPFVEGDDYPEYLREIGKLLTADPEIRRCCDTFMKANLAEFIKAAFAEKAA